MHVWINLSNRSSNDLSEDRNTLLVEFIHRPLIISHDAFKLICSNKIAFYFLIVKFFSFSLLFIISNDIYLAKYEESNP